MSTAKVAITIDEQVLKELDGLVRRKLFPNRSRAIQQAIREKLDRLGRGRLAAECAKLDPAFERKMAEEGMSAEAGQWPEY